MSHVNCLRCPLAELLEADHPLGPTDMSQKSPMIFCPLWGNPRPMLFEACPRAEAEGVMRTTNASAVELAYSRTRYRAGEDIAVMSRRTGRSRRVLYNQGRHHGWSGRIKSVAVRQMVSQRMAQGAREHRLKQGRSFTPEQSAYIQQAHFGDEWPRNTGRNTGALKAEQDRLREALVQRVARLGPPWSWRSIYQHAYLTQPATRRRQRNRKR